MNADFTTLKGEDVVVKHSKSAQQGNEENSNVHGDQLDDGVRTNPKDKHDGLTEVENDNNKFSVINIENLQLSKDKPSEKKMSHSIGAIIEDSHSDLNIAKSVIIFLLINSFLYVLHNNI